MRSAEQRGLGIDPSQDQPTAADGSTRDLVDQPVLNRTETPTEAFTEDPGATYTPASRPATTSPAAPVAGADQAPLTAAVRNGLPAVPSEPGPEPVMVTDEALARIDELLDSLQAIQDEVDDLFQLPKG